jgi:thiamine pyrophosphate-dependent acetolactate synthase large subunit-like protein
VTSAGVPSGSSDPLAVAPTAGEAVAATLVAHGVTDLFGIPGIHTLGLYDGIAQRPELHHITTRHEQGAGFAADGYARVSGRPGVACVTTGPGAFNALSAVAEAWADSSRVLLLAGQIATHELGRRAGVLHETPDQAAGYRPVTAYAGEPRTAAAIPDAVSEAFRAMASGRRRPAYVELPNDLLRAPVAGFAPVVHAEPARPAPAEEDIRRASAALREARRPLILLGAGVTVSRAGEELRRLAERLGAPVLPTGPAMGTLADDHPLCGDFVSGTNPAHAALFAEADLVLAAGCHLGFNATAYWTVPLPRLIHLDIDPAAIGVRYAPEVALVGDAAAGLAALLDELGPVSRAAAADPDWGAARAVRARRELRASFHPGVQRIDRAMLAARRELPRESVVTHDAAGFNFWSAYAWPAYRPAGSLWPWGSATLGFGLPTAIGAAVALGGEVPVVAACGDGGFLFTAMELATAVAQGLPVITLVHNDGGFRSIGYHQQRHFGGREIGVELVNPDLVAFARSFGAHADRVADIADLPAAVARAVATRGPAVIEITDPLGRPWG